MPIQIRRDQQRAVNVPLQPQLDSTVAPEKTGESMRQPTRSQNTSENSTSSPAADGLAKKTSLTAASTLISTAVRLIGNIAVARTLQPNGFGAFTYLLWVAETTNLITNFGATQGLSRFIPSLIGQNRTEDCERLQLWVIRRQLWCSAIGIIALFPILLISNAEPAIIIPVLALVATQAASNLSTALYTGHQKFYALALINIFGSALTAGLQFTGATLYATPGAVVGTSIGACLAAVVGLYAFRLGGPRSAPNQLLKEFKTYSWHAWLAMVVSSFVWARMELFFLNKYSGRSEVAMFSTALTAASLPLQFSQLLSGAMLPHMSALHGLHHHEKLAKLYADATTMISALLIPSCCIGAAVIPVLLPIVYGPGFTAAGRIASVLMLCSAFGAATIGSSLVYAHGRASAILKMGAGGAVAAVLLCAWIVPARGALGAAWCRFGIQSILTIIGVIYISVKLKIKFPLVEIMQVIAYSALSGAASFAIIRYYPTAFGAALAISLGAGVYALLISRSSILRPYAKSAYQAVAAIVSRAHSVSRA